MFERITKKSDFLMAAKKGRPFLVYELGFKIIKNNLSKNRYGIVVSLKVDKQAVVRNKIRRRIREVIRLKDTQLKQGFDIMILVRESIKYLNYKEIEEKLIFLFRKAGLVISNL